MSESLYAPSSDFLTSSADAGIVAISRRASFSGILAQLVPCWNIVPTLKGANPTKSNPK